MTNFERVSHMNFAFGNPSANIAYVSWDKVARQTSNIANELAETFIGLGANKEKTKKAAEVFKAELLALFDEGKKAETEIQLNAVRDGLCDIHVFAYGSHHLMGIDADADMNAVIDGVMTRFIKNQEDKEATIALHAAKGVTDVYFEGEFPTMIMKSASDQPDAPKGKFLKSASYTEPTFYEI